MSNPSSQPAISGAVNSGWNFPPPDDPSASSAATHLPDTHKATAFCRRNTTLVSHEEQHLKIHGYSTEEIARSEKALVQRNITPSNSEIIGHLQSDNGDTLGTIKQCIENGLSSTAGVQGKLRLLMELQSYTKSCVKTAAENLNRQYSSFWPDRQSIVTMVNKWPSTLQRQGAVICKSWPELLVDNAVQVDFSSSISICSNELNFQLEPLDCLSFLRLVKDIWFDALSGGNICAIDRVSHLLVTFAWEMSFNLYYLRGSSPTHDRHERFEQVVQQMLQQGIHCIDDIDAFAFMLVTKPHIWRNHQSDVLQLMVCRAFKGRDQQLSPLCARWREDAKSHEQIAKTVETEIIPDTASAMHYLNDIHGYLMQYRDRHPNCSDSSQIHNAKYFDPVTLQLISPILAPDLTTTPALEVTGATLSAYFNFCLDHQALSSNKTFEDFLTNRVVPDISVPGYFGLLESTDNAESMASRPGTSAELSTIRSHGEMPKRRKKLAKSPVVPRSLTRD
ncbi:hypothetical protein [Salinisphaera sp. G21_0]|uniref:hypothetical protein n=1 Tax=Salinisphaera sp. G21_0 TaxID=2821094 RepID=UPI001ADAB528|nr:hypothetical protein [Salinisphaera sp. G21_0]MBO9481595.1 hypothetical protein [Salinisphaera sp. G21_0]